MAKSSYFETDQTPVGRITVSSGGRVGTLETVTGLTVSQKQIGGPLVQTTFTLTAMPQGVTNGTEYQGTKLWTFPIGKILLLNASFSLSQKTTSVVADTLNPSSPGLLSVGTVTAIDKTLAGNDNLIVTKKAITSSAVINVSLGAVTESKSFAAALAVAASDTTALEVWLNSEYTDTAHVDGDATQTFTGTIKIEWLYLGGISSLFG